MKFYMRMEVNLEGETDESGESAEMTKILSTKIYLSTDGIEWLLVEGDDVSTVLEKNVAQLLKEKKERKEDEGA